MAGHGDGRGEREARGPRQVAEAPDQGQDEERRGRQEPEPGQRDDVEHEDAQDDGHAPEPGGAGPGAPAGVPAREMGRAENDEDAADDRRHQPRSRPRIGHAERLDEGGGAERREDAAADRAGPPHRGGSIAERGAVGNRSARGLDSEEVIGDDGGTARVSGRGDAGHRRVLAWMCLLIAVNQLGFGGIVPALALYARSFGVGQTAIGVAIGVYGLARFLTAVPAGRLADRVGRRHALAGGGLVTAAGNLLCAYAPDYATFAAARFVAGAGAAIVLTCGLVVLADITTPAHRGRSMAIYQGVFGFAVGIGPLPGGLLAERVGLHAPFVAYAVSGAGVTALAWLFVPETRGLRPGRDGGGEPPRALGAQLRALAARRGFLLVSLVSFTSAVARTGALFNLIPLLARDRLGLAADRIGVGLAVASVVGLALAYPSGALVDRHGRKAVIVPATIVAGAALAVFLLAPSYGWFLAGCVVWSVAAGMSGAAPAAYAADVAPPGMNAAAMGAYRMLSDLGYVAGPIALGLAADLAGADAALGVTAALLLAVALLFARLAPETYRPGRA